MNRATSRISFGLAALVAVLWLGGGVLQAQALPEMTFSTLFGTEWWDTGKAVAVNPEGYTYLAGHFESSWTQDIADAFILKVAPGGGLVWSVRLGGSGWDEAIGLAVGAGGEVWVTGRTESPDFPAVDSWQPTGRGGPFLARLSPAGELEFSTVFGDPRDVGVLGIGKDAQGFIYLGGFTSSPTFPPGTGGTDSSRSYVLKIDPVGPRIVWGAEVENPDQWPQILTAFAVDPAGRAYLGWFSQTARLNAAGSSLDYLLPIGSRGLAADADGNAYLLSSAAGRGDFDASDVLVERLGSTGELTGSFVFGGSWDDWPTAITTDPSGDVYVVGETSSGDFPLVDPVQPRCPNAEEYDSCWPMGFLTRIRPDTWEIRHSTFIGGGETVSHRDDYTAPTAVAAGFGAVAVGGWTTDGDFTVLNAFQTTVAGSEDAFLVRIAFNQAPDCTTATATPGTLWPANGKLVPVTIGGVTDADGGPVTISVTAIRQDEPLSKKGQPDATGLGTSSPRLRASRAGKEDGRVYHITFEATDPAGAACTGTVTVCVPHDRGQRTCGDGGAVVDSSGGG